MARRNLGTETWGRKFGAGKKLKKIKKIIKIQKTQKITKNKKLQKIFVFCLFSGEALCKKPIRKVLRPINLYTSQHNTL